VKVLVTGAAGFVGRNLCVRLSERPEFQVLKFTRDSDPGGLVSMLAGVDVVVHLAGVNRPKDPAEFFGGNTGLTQTLADSLRASALASGHRARVLHVSSTQASRDNDYGRSKFAAEQAIGALRGEGFDVRVMRLPNIFGKWCRPNYNSAVATFCHNIARGLSIQVNDPAAPVTLVHVEDFVSRLVELVDGSGLPVDGDGFTQILPQYQTTVGEVAAAIVGFRESRGDLTIARVGTGLMRALYATYVSYLPTSLFSYRVPQYEDPRGKFAEMLKTPDCGQFSFFTAHPGVTRGGHYHHTKTEKFLVLKGDARFRFRNMDTGESHELFTSGAEAEIVETVPGWTHDITNVGDAEMIVMLWANEVFDRQRPDTVSSPL
jgi:UDP-2-acetamido-2,6-beta-L-arabino-hexul-4-ose reductase